MNVIRNGGILYDFVYKIFDIENIDNETDDEFKYRRRKKKEERRKMEDLFKQKKKEYLNTLNN